MSSDLKLVRRFFSKDKRSELAVQEVFEMLWSVGRSLGLSASSFLQGEDADALPAPYTPAAASDTINNVFEGNTYEGDSFDLGDFTMNAYTDENHYSIDLVNLFSLIQPVGIDGSVSLVAGVSTMMVSGRAVQVYGIRSLYSGQGINAGLMAGELTVSLDLYPGTISGFNAANDQVLSHSGAADPEWIDSSSSGGGGPPVKVTGGGPGEYHTGDVYANGFDVTKTESNVRLRFPGLGATETVPTNTELPFSNPIVESYAGSPTTVYYVSVKVAL